MLEVPAGEEGQGVLVEVMAEVLEVVAEVVEEGTGVQRRWRRPYQVCQEKTIPS